MKLLKIWLLFLIFGIQPCHAFFGMADYETSLNPSVSGDFYNKSLTYEFKFSEGSVVAQHLSYSTSFGFQDRIRVEYSYLKDVGGSDIEISESDFESFKITYQKNISELMSVGGIITQLNSQRFSKIQNFSLGISSFFDKFTFSSYLSNQILSGPIFKNYLDSDVIRFFLIPQWINSIEYSTNFIRFLYQTSNYYGFQSGAIFARANEFIEIGIGFHDYLISEPVTYDSNVIKLFNDISDLINFESAVPKYKKITIPEIGLKFLIKPISLSIDYQFSNLISSYKKFSMGIKIQI